MEKFKKKLYGYDPKEVNDFLDNIIDQVEDLVVDMKKREKEINNLNERIAEYKKMEDTLNKAIMIAHETGEQLRKTASDDARRTIDEAKANASRILNEALMQSEQIQITAEKINRNIIRFKEKTRRQIHEQLQIIDDIEVLDI